MPDERPVEASRALEGADLARARGRGYALLADLVAHGPSPRTVPLARASELLALALDAYPSLDEAAADHQHVFGFSVPAFEGAFLDPEGVVGGALADRLHDTYRAAGFSPDPTTEEAEHLATELRALAHLSAAEADALLDGLAPMVEHIRALSVRVLDGHVLRWLPTLGAVVRGTDRVWPRALVEQIEDLLVMHRTALGGRVGASDAFELPPLGAILDDERTGLADVARVLATPALTGTFLSRDDIAQIGRASRVPRGFGDRRVLLENLLRSSVELGSLDAVITGLVSLLRERDAALAAPHLREVPGLAAILSPLHARIVETMAMLERVEAATHHPDTNGNDAAP
jgi:TorA maturation chaperone TorD